MSTLYHKAGQMIVNWSGEDVAGRTDPRQVARTIVDMVIAEMKEKGATGIELVAAHDVAKVD